MKIRRSAVATAALAASGAYAQSSSVTATPSTSYLTVTYSDCPSMSMENMVTITNGVTVTYCPECDMASSKPGYTTVYTTQYEALCPTGMTTSTYTVTESCTDSTPTWTPGPKHIPQGFTVTTQVCTQCAETPQTVTITQPCGCEAHEGSVVTPTATAGSSPAAAPAQSAPAQTTAESVPSGQPVGQISDGQVQASTGAGRLASTGMSAAPAGSAPAGSSGSGIPPAPSGGSGSGSSPAPNSGSGSSAPAPAPGAGSGNGSAPALATTAATCPGAACRAGSSSMPSGVAPNWSSSSGSAGSGPGVSTGAASRLGSSGLFWSAFFAVATGALAFTL